MTVIKFIATALAATAVFTTSTLANPVPPTVTTVTIPGIILPFTTLEPITITATNPAGSQVTTSVNQHLEKRACNEHGCGLKCKGTANSYCKQKPQTFSDCDICSYFKYAADGSAVSPGISIAKSCFFANHYSYRPSLGISSVSASRETRVPPTQNARRLLLLDSPKALMHGNGVDGCVQIWFAGI